MADLAGLSYFQVDQLVNGLVPDTLDVGLDPDFYNVWMSLEIVTRVEGAPGLSSLRLAELTPPRTLILTITDARIETGVLRLPRANAPSGETTPPTSGQIADQQASAGLRLLAHSDVLGIGDRRLLYDFNIGETKINGRPYRLPGFTIAAPHVDPSTYDTNNPPRIDLTTAPRVVDENPAFGSGRIASIPDAYDVDGAGGIRFTAAGVALGPRFIPNWVGMPASMDDITDAQAPGKALVRAASQAAARTAISAAPADGSGKLLASALPDLGVVQFKGTKADQAAMLATSGESMDWVIRNDTGAAWVITGPDPTQLSSWTMWPYPSLTWGTVSSLLAANAAAGRSALGVAPIPTAITTLTEATAPTPGMITLYNASAGALAVPLLALSGLNVGDSWWVGKSDSSGNAVTFTASAGNLFDTGAATHTVSIVEKVHLQVVSVGGVKRWSVLDSHKPLPSLDARYPVVTPEMFGAVGDGRDDAVALRNMFLSAATNGGVTIHFPRGKNYCSTLPMDVKSNTEVFGPGGMKCTGFHSAGMFIQIKNAIKNVTWIGPTVDINYFKNMNGFGIGDVPNTTDFVSDIHIEAKVFRTRIETGNVATGGEGGNAIVGGGLPVLYAGGGKAFTVQFRARNVYLNVMTEDCDIALSIEAAVSSSRWLENVVIDLQAKDSHRCAIFVGGSRDGIPSSSSASFMHSQYPGVKIRARVQGGQDGLCVNPVTGALDGSNWDNAGVLTMNYASGIDVELYVATQSRCTLVRGMAAASTIRITTALMDELQDVWDTRPIDTLTPAGSIMSDNVFEANVHAAIHDGVLVRPHRDTPGGSPAMQRTQIDINAWCQNGVGPITQSDGTTDGFGASVAYRFCDMKSSPIKEIGGFSGFDAKPQWSAAPNGGKVWRGNLIANNHISGRISTPTSSTDVAVMTLASQPIQRWTGDQAQIVKQASAGVVSGQSNVHINDGTVSGLVVQSANTNLIYIVPPGRMALFTAKIDDPVANTDWTWTLLNMSIAATGNTAVQRDSTGAVFAAPSLTVGAALSRAAVPASASAAGVAGQIAWNANFVYVCTATNTWVRTALAAW